MPQYFHGPTSEDLQSVYWARVIVPPSSSAFWQVDNGSQILLKGMQSLRAREVPIQKEDLIQNPTDAFLDRIGWLGERPESLVVPIKRLNQAIVKVPFRLKVTGNVEFEFSQDIYEPYPDAVSSGSALSGSVIGGYGSGRFQYGLVGASYVWAINAAQSTQTIGTSKLITHIKRIVIWDRGTVATALAGNFKLQVSTTRSTGTIGQTPFIRQSNAGAAQAQFLVTNPGNGLTPNRNAYDFDIFIPTYLGQPMQPIVIDFDGSVQPMVELDPNKGELCAALLYTGNNSVSLMSMSVDWMEY